MSDLLLLGAGLIVGAALLFGLSFGLGMLLGRRFDRVLEARHAAAAEAEVVGAPGDGRAAAAAPDKTEPHDTQLKETRGG
jgi:hypothetical protein